MRDRSDDPSHLSGRSTTQLHLAALIENLQNALHTMFSPLINVLIFNNISHSFDVPTFLFIVNYRAVFDHNINIISSFFSLARCMSKKCE